MSYSIKGTDITLTRGDSLFLQLNLTKDGEPYTPENGSIVRFAMKAKYTDPDEKVVLVKNIPIDTMILEIEPEDTKNLPMKKTYVYDIQLTDALGHIYTFLFGTLTLGEEVL